MAQLLFPQSLKRAKILPIFKSKDKLNITNYRPISILPVINKVYEKVFYSRLYAYFSTNNLLSSSQFGFRSGVSTEHALLKFTDISKCFDDNKVGIATFMDLSKAIDCVGLLTACQIILQKDLLINPHLLIYMYMIVTLIIYIYLYIYISTYWRMFKFKFKCVLLRKEIYIEHKIF